MSKNKHHKQHQGNPAAESMLNDSKPRPENIPEPTDKPTLEALVHVIVKEAQHLLHQRKKSIINLVEATEAYEKAKKEQEK